MALQGVTYELTEENKDYAVRYCQQGGFYKNRLADFLGISRPTLDKLLEDNPDFFTALKRADAVFCKNLIDAVSRKNPIFILKTKRIVDLPSPAITDFGGYLKTKKTTAILSARITT